MGIIRESLGHIPTLGLQGYTIKSYMIILSKNYFMKSLTYSIYIAFTASIIATILGIVIAYYLIGCQNKWIRSVVKRVLQLGMILPYLYVVFLGMILLSQTGFISRLFYHVGIIKEPSSFPEIIFDRNGIGIIWAFVFKGTPFIALFVMNVMSRISNTYGEVVQSLGGGKITLLRKIYIPLSSSTIIWTSCIVFAYALGSFEVNYLLSSISPVPLSAKLYSLYINPNLKVIPQTMALNVILFLIGSLLVVMYAALLKFVTNRRL